MKSLKVQLVLIWIAMLAYGFLLPRESIELSEIEIEVIDPYATDEPETLSIEDPTWVYPIFQENSVTVTIYHAVEAQTDDSPDVLADGTKIDLSKAGQYRYCALSRDLLERWEGPYAYGDTVWLEGAGKFSGPWIVKDTMNKRFYNRMDLLVDLNTNNVKFEVATIWKEI